MKHTKYFFPPLLFIFGLDTSPREIEYKSKIQNISYLARAYLQKPLNFYSLKVITELIGIPIKVIIHGHLSFIQNRNRSNFRCKTTELLRMLVFAATCAPSPAYSEYLRTFLS